MNPQKFKSEVPTSKGIEKFVHDSGLLYIHQFEKFVKDTFQFDLYIFTQDLSKEPDYDPNELGRYYIPDIIYINNQPEYSAYRLAELHRSKQRNFTKNNNFVKAVLLHEIAHAYFTQTVLIMRINEQQVNSSFNTLRMFPNKEKVFGAAFIEEGFCEYCVQQMKESLFPENPYKPKTIDDIVDNNNVVEVKYEYASYYLTEFLNQTGIQEGLQIILRNDPPSFEEIINPDHYFNRLK